MPCTTPEYGDSEWDLLQKILITLNTKTATPVPDCNNPTYNDSEWDLLSKILKSVQLL